MLETQETYNPISYLYVFFYILRDTELHDTVTEQ